MPDIHFKFSSDKQRNYNKTGKPRAGEDIVRKNNRHQFNVKINLPMGYLKTISPPEGVNFIRYAVKDPRTQQHIPPFTKEYDEFKPVNCTFIVASVDPFPLARFDQIDLYSWLQDTFGKYIIDWNITEKDEPSLSTFAHQDKVMYKLEGMMENNEITGQDNLNKNMFNIREKMIYQHELNALNKKLEMMGYKTIKTSNALMSTEKTINTQSKHYFEYGEL